MSNYKIPYPLRKICVPILWGCSLVLGKYMSRNNIGYYVTKSENELLNLKKNTKNVSSFREYIRRDIRRPNFA